MKIVDKNLIPELISLSERQFIKPVNIEANIYSVEVISVDCINEHFYKLEVKILSDKYPEQPILIGTCNRTRKDFSDLEEWLGDGESDKITTANQCKGKIGTVSYQNTKENYFILYPKCIFGNWS